MKQNFKPMGFDFPSPILLHNLKMQPFLSCCFIIKAFKLLDNGAFNVKKLLEIICACNSISGATLLALIPSIVLRGSEQVCHWFKTYLQAGSSVVVEIQIPAAPG